MKNVNNRNYIQNYFFIGCLIILLANDHFFKQQFSNWFTGKLSDIVGILILPLFLSYLFPKIKSYSLIISGLIFLFWKSEFSTPLIILFNKFSFIQFDRIIDYSDLYVLILLRIPYLILTEQKFIKTSKQPRFNHFIIAVIAAFSFVATAAPPSYYYTKSTGNLCCNKCKITIDAPQNKILENLKKNGLTFDSATVINLRYKNTKRLSAVAYKKSNLIIAQDTLRDLDISMVSLKKNKTEIYFNGMNVPKNLSSQKLQRKLRIYYKQLLFRELKNKIE